MFHHKRMCIVGYMVGKKERKGIDELKDYLIWFFLQGSCLKFGWYVFVSILLANNFLLSSTSVIFTACYTAVLFMLNILSSHRPCYQCPDCPRTLKSSRGLAQHRNSVHRVITPPPDDGEEDEDENKYTYCSHPFLNGKYGQFSSLKQ